MNPRHKIPSLDSVRGLLSLMVVVPHAWQVFVTPYTWQSNVTLGVVARLAVVWFFCLSGHVIAMSIDTNRRTGSFNPLAFASARISRIVPPLIITAVLIYAMGVGLYFAEAQLSKYAHAARKGYYFNLGAQAHALLSLGVSGDLTGFLNGPLWSLTHEIQLYVVAGLMATAMWSRGLVRPLALAMLALYTGALNVTPFHVTIALAFAFGALSYVLRGRVRVMTVALLFSLMVTGVLAVAVPTLPLESMDTAPPWLQFQVAAASAGASAIGLVSRSRLSFGQSLGAWSYTLYILHFPVLLFLWLIASRHLPEWTDRWRYFAMILATVVTVGVCAWVGRYAEGVKVRVFRQPVADAA